MYRYARTCTLYIELHVSRFLILCLYTNIPTRIDVSQHTLHTLVLLLVRVWQCDEHIAYLRTNVYITLYIFTFHCLYMCLLLALTEKCVIPSETINCICRR